jgi:hypothetical protein
MKRSLLMLHAELNPDVRSDLRGYEELYFRFLKACREFPRIRHDEPSLDAFPSLNNATSRSQLPFVKKRWRAEFERSAS